MAASFRETRKKILLFVVLVDEFDKHAVAIEPNGKPLSRISLLVADHTVHGGDYVLVGDSRVAPGNPGMHPDAVRPALFHDIASSHNAI